jgi:membrane protein
LFLGLGLLIVTLVSGLLQFVGTRNITLLGQTHSLGQLSSLLLYLVGVIGEALLLTAIYLVMPVGRLSLRHALIGGATATLLWEITATSSHGITQPCRKCSSSTGLSRRPWRYF